MLIYKVKSVFIKSENIQNQNSRSSIKFRLSKCIAILIYRKIKNLNSNLTFIKDIFLSKYYNMTFYNLFLLLKNYENVKTIDQTRLTIIIL